MNLTEMRRKAITPESAISFSLVMFILSGAYFAFEVKSIAKSNEHRVLVLERQREVLEEQNRNILEKASKIEGKMDVLLLEFRKKKP